MRVLIIYENVPESTQFFLVDDMTEELFQHLIKVSHNKFQNASDLTDKEVNELAEFAAKIQEHPSVYREITPLEVPTCRPDGIIWTGFLM